MNLERLLGTYSIIMLMEWSRETPWYKTMFLCFNFLSKKNKSNENYKKTSCAYFMVLTSSKNVFFAFSSSMSRTAFTAT